ncbi:MAG: hypothetical protein U1F34_01285 [Gammaproteobacteria bacterium]
MGLTSYKEILSAVAIALTLIAYVPYICTIIRGTTKPHVFSWIIWGASTLMVFFAQLASNAGVGAWVVGFSGSITMSIAILAFVKRGDVSITRVDWMFFTAAMTALGLWKLTSDPLWAVVILTVVDVLAFGPTVRKVLNNPYSESGIFYFTFTVRNSLVIMALESYSLTTMLFPAAMALSCVLMTVVIAYCRRMRVA